MKRLAILAIVLWFAVPSQSAQKTSSSEGGGNQSTADKRGTQEAPLIVETHPADGDQEAAKEAQRDEEQKRTNRWNVGLTFAIAVCALLQFGGIVAQVWVYLQQTRIMQNLLRTTEIQAAQMAAQTEILKQSVAVAQASANAAEKSALAAMGLSTPILVLQKLSLNYSPGQQPSSFFRYPEFRVEIKNFGQSPAFLKSYTIDVAAGDLPEDPIYSEPWECDMQEVVDSGASHLLGAGDGRCASPKHPDSDMVQELASEKKNLIVYGTVTYGDVFGNSLRVMKFCKIFWELVNAAGEWRDDPLMADWGGPRYTGQSDSQNPN